MVIHYHTDIVQEYKGLELMNPDGCTDDPVVQFKNIISIPDDFVMGKFRRILQKAYFGIMGSPNGFIGEPGVVVNNGFHRSIVFYMLVGQEGHIPIRYGGKIEDPCNTETDVPGKIEEIVKREGLIEAAREEIVKLDKAEAFNETPGYDLLKALLLPWKLPGYFKILTYDDNIGFGSDRKGKKLTQEHLARLQ